jgi:hypothetical protein
MANRYPLILDTTDGNKIKELPEGDNLYLRTNSIEEVQNVNALGVINAADITIAGERLQPKTILDLTDTPSTYTGQSNKILKVNSASNGVDFVDIADIGDITAGTINLAGDIIPTVDDFSDLGSDSNRFDSVFSNNLYGDLRGFDGSLVFDASTSKILYAAIIGAPDSVSEFTNDVGYVTISEVDDYLNNNLTISDFRGSVFADDSTLLVDGVAARINPAAIFGEFGGEVSGPSFRTSTLINETDLLITTDGPFLTQSIDIQPGGTTSFVNIISPNIQFLGDIVNRLQLEEGVDVKNGITGDITGSVYYDDSTQIIDAVSGKIVSPTVSGNATFENNVTVDENLTITGNLIVNGTTTSVETENTTIKDNIIVLNQGETSAGITNTTAGLEIDRGTESNVLFVYDDSIDKWSFGSETVVADVVEADLTGNVTGDVTGDLTGDVIGNVTGNVDGDVTGNVTGNVDGDVNGSIFADDSTLLVDGVNATVPGTLTGSWNNTGNVFNVIGNGLALTTPSSAFSVTDTGLAHSLNFTGGSLSYGITNTGIGMAFSDADESLAVSIGNNGFNFNHSSTGTSESLSINNGNLNASLSGNASFVLVDFNVFNSGTVNWSAGTNFLVTAPNASIDSTGFIGNITGNIDNTTLDIGTTDATSINIGNPSSAIVMDGTLQLNSALIVNNLIADDSISITTTEGDSNAITLGPQGTNTFVNVTADNIRFFGPVTTNINAVAGITGDVVGSVFGDDSTALVDAVNNQLNADKLIVDTVESTSGLILLSQAGINMTATTSALLRSLDGNFDISASNGTASLSASSGAGGVSIDDVTGNIDIVTTGVTTIQGAANAPVNIGSGTSGTVTLGSGSNTIVVANGSTVDFTGADVTSLEDAVIDWTPIVSGVLVNNGLPVLPTQTLDISGSVFADDSSLMIDAVNFTMFSDAMTLTPLSAEPTELMSGMLVAADGVNWDPATKSGTVPYPVFYDGVAWNALY